MRRALAALFLAIAAVCAAPAVATAGVPVSKLLIISPGSPLAQVQSLDTVPLGWSTSARQAVAAAERTPTMQALHRRMHPLQVVPFVWRSRHPDWYVVFKYRSRIVADADVSSTGKVTGVWTGVQALAPYTHGNLAPIVSAWWAFVPAALLFILPFIDPRRLRRVTLIDGFVIVSLLASYELLTHGELEPAVWLAYPPLLYLLFRLLRLGFGRGGSAGRIAPLLGTRALLVGLPLLLAARIVASILGHQELDVGTESVFGAYRLLHHLPLYWNDANHGDTYWPVTYLAYVPFVLLFPLKSMFASSHGAADAAAIFFDLGTVGALILLGRQLRRGAEGTRLGLVLAWAWAACPFTIYGLVVHTNDALVSMLGVLALLAFTSPLASGAMLGLATAAKLSPAGLLPLLASPRQRGRKGALVCVAAFIVVVVTAIISWLPPGGLGYFWQRTIEFQLNRPDVYSPWALHPTLHPLQTMTEVGAIVLAAAVAFIPRERSFAQVCALAGAITIAIQLPATHWYYYYIMWFLPFALVGLLVTGHSHGTDSGPVTKSDVDELTPERVERETALAGV